MSVVCSMDLTKGIENFNLVFIDLETTGLDAVTGDFICEIGAFKVKQRKVFDEFHSLVKPKKSMPRQAYEVHKISDEELSDAPCFEELADKLISFLEGSVVCAYNIGFDMGFINHHLKKMGRLSLELPSLDVLSMARDLLELPRYNLDAAAKFFNVDCSQGLHRASSDAMIACKVFLELMDICREKKIERLDEYVSLYGLSNEMFKAREEEKILLLKKAADAQSILRIRYFSSAAALEEKDVLPLDIFQEGRQMCLLYQGKGEGSSRLRLRRILNIWESGED